jgi:DNA-binding response OmpR family regulator
LLGERSLQLTPKELGLLELMQRGRILTRDRRLETVRGVGYRFVGRGRPPSAETLTMRLRNRRSS